MHSRFRSVIKKEFIQFLRDRRMVIVAFVTPLIQLLLLGYVATTDVVHVPLGVLDRDRTSVSREIVTGMTHTQYVDLKYYLNDEADMKKKLDDSQIQVAVNIPPDFSSKLLVNKPSNIQVIMDGSNVSMASVAYSYVAQMMHTSVQDILKKEPPWHPIDVRTRIWYNEELKSVYFMIPALVALLLTLQATLFPAFAIVKEKERGTLEQLIVSPIRPWELLFGKFLPYILINFFNIFLITGVGIFWFQVPLRGSFLLLLLLGVVFLATNLGQGLFISTISATRTQALMSVIFVMIPSIILSGFIFPIDNMPQFVQLVTYLLPIRYFLVIVRGIFLKGVGLDVLWSEIWPLIIFGTVIFGLSVLRFKKKIS